MKIGLILAVVLSSSASWAVPTWFPSSFAPNPAPNSELSEYLQVQRLDIADSIHSMGSVEVDGKRLVVHFWKPVQAAGTVFLIHGYYNQSGAWSDHVRRLLARHLAVIAFDLPGHGLSDGKPMDVDSFGQYVKGLRALEDSMRGRAPQPWEAVGHSLGGAVILERARSADFPYRKVALLAPMLRYKGWGWIGAALPVLAPFKDYMSRGRKLASSSDTDFLRRRLSDPLEGWTTSTHWLGEIRHWNSSLETATFAKADWVLFQGGLDQTIDWEYGTPWLQAHFPGLKTLWFPLARHHLHNEGGRTGASVRRLLDDFLAIP